MLTAAIASEVVATVALKASDGFSRPVPSAIVVVGYLLSFWLLALVLKQLSVGTTYAIWSAAGTAAVALIGIAAVRRGRLDAQARVARPYRARRDRAQCRRRALEIAPRRRADGRPPRRRAGADAGRRRRRGRGLQGRAALPLQVQARPRGGDGRALDGRVPARDRRGGPEFVRGYVKASAPAGNELGMLAALVADPSLLVAVRRQYGIWQDRVEREGARSGRRDRRPAGRGRAVARRAAGDGPADREPCATRFWSD